MPIPDVSKNGVIQAPQEFDENKRQTDAWRDWQAQLRRKCAIEWDGKL